MSLARRKFLVLSMGLLSIAPPVPSGAERWVLAQSGEKSPKEDRKEGQESKEARERKEAGAIRLRIEVTAGEKGELVEGASVYVRYLEERKLAKDQMHEMNFKTNREGVVKVPSVPRGKVLVQVIAPGWKTFGQWYDVEKEEQTIKIRLQKPPRWY